MDLLPETSIWAIVIVASITIAAAILFGVVLGAWLAL
jgi:uncharacterized protein YneF (UPF0154 family)